MPSFFRNTSGGKSVSGGALSPRSRRGNSTDQVASYWAGGAPGLPQLGIPELSAYAYGADGAFTFTITNFNSSYSYNITAASGSISRTTNTVTVSGLGNGATLTVSVVASFSGFSPSKTASIVGQTKPVCSSCGGGTTSVQGCNGGTCGIIACGSGYCPAYDIVFYYSPSPNPCIGCAAAVGGWYCCPCGGACG